MTSNESDYYRANVLPIPVIDSGNLGLNPEWLATDTNAGVSSSFGGLRADNTTAKETCTSRARKKAVLIGITYQSAEARNDFDLGALTEAYEDVMQMKKLLMDKYDYSEGNVDILIDAQKHRTPTRSHIEKSIESLAANIEAGDRLLLWYRGYGALLHAGVKEFGRNTAIIPCDAKYSLGRSNDVGGLEQITGGDSWLSTEDILKSVTKHLPAGSKLTMIYDIFHAQTASGLSCLPAPFGRWTSPTSQSEPNSALLSPADSGVYEQCSENPDSSYPRSFAIQSFSVRERRTPTTQTQRVKEGYDPSSIPMCTACGLKIYRDSDPKEKGDNGPHTSNQATQEKENVILSKEQSSPISRHSEINQFTDRSAHSPLKRPEAPKENGQHPIHHPPVSRALIVHQDLAKFNIYGLVRGMGGIFRSFFKGYRPATIKSPNLTRRSNGNASPVVRQSQGSQLPKPKTADLSNEVAKQKDLSIRVSIPTTDDFTDEFGGLCSTGPVTVPKCKCERTLRTVGPASETAEIEEVSFAVHLPDTDNVQSSVGKFSFAGYLTKIIEVDSQPTIKAVISGLESILNDYQGTRYEVHRKSISNSSEGDTVKRTGAAQEDFSQPFDL